MSQDCECEEQECPEGMPAWVMTFADLMSLLLAFFVLLFSFSEIDKQAYKQMAGSMKNAFGVQREVRADKAPMGNNIIAREFSPGRPIPTPENVVRQMTTDDLHKYPKIYDAQKQSKQSQAKKADSGEVKSKAVKAEKVIKPTKAESVDKSIIAGNKNNSLKGKQEHLERVEQDIEHDIKIIRKELKEEIKKGLIELEIKDEQIILRIREKGSFPSGSADIIKPFKKVANKIADAFSNFNGEIIVSGNTDNVPIHTKHYRSNWELSAARAVSVIQELQKYPKLRNKHFRLEAYADTKPLESNKTWQGRAKNRRVEIRLSYEHVSVNKSVFKKQLKESVMKPENKADQVMIKEKIDSGLVNKKQKNKKVIISPLLNKVNKDAKK